MTRLADMLAPETARELRRTFGRPDDELLVLDELTPEEIAEEIAARREAAAAIGAQLAADDLAGRPRGEGWRHRARTKRHWLEMEIGKLEAARARPRRRGDAAE